MLGRSRCVQIFQIAVAVCTYRILVLIRVFTKESVEYSVRDWKFYLYQRRDGACNTCFLFFLLTRLSTHHCRRFLTRRRQGEKKGEKKGWFSGLVSFVFGDRGQQGFARQDLDRRSS